MYTELSKKLRLGMVILGPDLFACLRCLVKIRIVLNFFPTQLNPAFLFSVEADEGCRGRAVRRRVRHSASRGKGGNLRGNTNERMNSHLTGLTYQLECLSISPQGGIISLIPLAGM